MVEQMTQTALLEQTASVVAAVAVAVPLLETTAEQAALAWLSSDTGSKTSHDHK